MNTSKFDPAIYEAFLRAKVPASSDCGFFCDPSEVNPIAKPHQRDAIAWLVRRGRGALFEAFGLGKTLQQLEFCRLTLAKVDAGRKQEEFCPFNRALIVAPLGVRQEFKHDAEMLGLEIKFVRRIEECDTTGLYLTNYETVRDGKLDPKQFTVVSLDEAGILRGFGGTKTFREFMRHFENSGVYRCVATATPSPNEYIELLAYAAFLDVMDVGQAKTRFFKRDSTKADVLTLHPHKEREFWLWMASWALFLQTPSDLGYDNEGYTLPEMEIHWHELPSDYTDCGQEVNGQGRLVRNSAIGVTHAAREKRDSLPARVQKAVELMPVDNEQFIVWCDLNDEQRAIDKMLKALGIPGSSIYGSTPEEDREEMIADWRAKKTVAFVSKPSMYGAGINLQQCRMAIFVGVGFKFSEWIQACKRIHRFLQDRTVIIHIIYTEAEREIRRNLERKWEQHKTLVAQMSSIIQQYGLASNATAYELRRQFGVEREEQTGEDFTAVNNDSIPETARMDDDSAHLILTSIPFSTQYEYSPSFHDFGHTDDNPHFWKQMDFLSPELYRVLKPGRLCAIHVKDRIVPGGMTGLGFQTVYPFHCDAIAHFVKHGFAYLGMKTIVTDVVRENNQTYRLGWSEQCKDGSRMGVGMPEYLLYFRKPPTDSSNGYADEPVTKDKPLCVDQAGQVVPFTPNLGIKKGTGYSRSRWQIDAHGFERSSGERLLCGEDLARLPHEKIYKLYRNYSLTHVYDHEHHVGLSETLEASMRLPVTFMLLPPQSWHPDVWTDITRMRTLNCAQQQKGREMHLCPMQFDLIDRVVRQFTMPGETVFDPFLGIGSVLNRAILQKRRGVGCELAHGYYLDAVMYCRMAEEKINTPTLFDMDEPEEGEELAISELVAQNDSVMPPQAGARE